MPATIQQEAPGRIGGPPAAEAQGTCDGCGHPYALHSNGKTACRAFACHAGPAGEPCQEYVTA